MQEWVIRAGVAPSAPMRLLLRQRFSRKHRPSSRFRNRQQIRHQENLLLNRSLTNRISSNLRRSNSPLHHPNLSLRLQSQIRHPTTLGRSRNRAQIRHNLPSRKTGSADYLGIGLYEEVRAADQTQRQVDMFWERQLLRSPTIYFPG